MLFGEGRAKGGLADVLTWPRTNSRMKEVPPEGSTGVDDGRSREVAGYLRNEPAPATETSYRKGARSQGQIGPGCAAAGWPSRPGQRPVKVHDEVLRPRGRSLLPVAEAAMCGETVDEQSVAVTYGSISRGSVRIDRF